MNDPVDESGQSSGFEVSEVGYGLLQKKIKISKKQKTKIIPEDQKDGKHG